MSRHNYNVKVSPRRGEWRQLWMTDVFEYRLNLMMLSRLNLQYSLQTVLHAWQLTALSLYLY